MRLSRDVLSTVTTNYLLDSSLLQFSLVCRDHLEVVRFVKRFPSFWVNRVEHDLRVSIVNEYPDIDWRKVYLSMKRPLGTFNILLHPNPYCVSLGLLSGVHPVQVGYPCPLWEACDDGNTPVVKLLLQDGRCDPSKCYGILHLPVERGHVEIVSLLLNDGRTDLEEFQYCGLVQQSCESGNHDMVKLLLNCTRVYIRNFDRCLYTSCCLGNIEIVRTLLDDGRFDPSWKNNRCIKKSISRDQREIVELLFKDSRVKTTLSEVERVNITSWLKK